MINLILEIPYSHQIEKLDEAILGPWFESLRNAVREISLEPVRLDSRTWRLTFPHIRASHIELAVDGIKRTWELMKAWQDKLVVFHGFVLDAEDFPGAMDTYSRLRKAVPHQNRFWADTKTKNVLGRGLCFEERETGLHEIMRFPEPEKPAAVPANFLEKETLDWFVGAQQNSLLAVETRIEEALGVLRQLELSGIDILNADTSFHLYCREGDSGLHPVVRGLRQWFAAPAANAGAASTAAAGGMPDGRSAATDTSASTSFGAAGTGAATKGGDSATTIATAAGPELAWLFSRANELGGVGVEPEDLIPRVYHTCLRNFAKTFLGRIRTLVLVNPSNLDESGKEFLEVFLSAFRPSENPVLVTVLDRDRQTLETIVEWAGFRESRITRCAESLEPFSRRTLELDESERALLDICHVADGFLDHDEVCELAEAEGINGLLVPGLLAGLHERLFIPEPGLAQLIHRVEPQAAARSGCALLLYKSWQQGKRVLVGAQIRALAAEIDDLPGLLRMGYQLVFCGNAAELENFAGALAARATGLRQANDAAARLFTAEAALLRGDFREAEKGLVALERLDGGRLSDLLDGYKRLLASRIEYAAGRLENLIQEVKPAILKFQDLEEGFAVCMGNLIYGFAVFAKGRLQEAKEYFQIATREAENVGLGWFVRVTAVFESLALSALGYHSRVLSAFGEDDDAASALYECGLTRWARYAGFMEARSRFLLGDYSESMEGFSALQQRFAVWPGNEIYAAKHAEDERWIGLFEVWAHRARTFIAEAAGRPLHVSVPERESPADYPEAVYFTAEALMLAGEFEKALQQLEKPAATNPQPIIPFHPAPVSGFQLFEDLYTGFTEGSPVLDHLREALGAYVAARSGQLKDGAERLFVLSRNRQIGPSDSYLHWYLSWYEDTLERLKNTEWEATSEDHNTILGKAIKAMQEKSSHIEDPGHRRYFLQNEYISRNLIRRGKQHNLI